MYAKKWDADGLLVTVAALFERPTTVPGENGLANWIRKNKNT